MRIRAILVGVSTAIAATMFLGGCTASSPEPTMGGESPQSTGSTPVVPPSMTPTPTGAADDVPDSEDSTAPVSFTFECYVPNESAPDGGNYLPYDTMEAAWENLDIISCRGEQHGQIITAQQEEAISVSLPSFGYDDPYLILESLYSQCATANLGYLDIDEYTGFQDENVRGILALCPHHPGADKMRAGLPSS